MTSSFLMQLLSLSASLVTHATGGLKLQQVCCGVMFWVVELRSHGHGGFRRSLDPE